MAFRSNAREAYIALGVDQRKLDGSLKTSSRKLKTWAGKTKADISKALRGSLEGLGSMAGVAGLAGLALATKSVLEFEQRLSRLQVASHSTAEEMVALKRAIFEAAKSRGVDASKILGGVEKFVALTGRVDIAAKSMDTFAMVASATGADIEDIAVAAAALSTNFGITGDQMKYAFGVLAVQGKAGAVELKDMAGIMAGLTPMFGTFGAKGTHALDELGASLQIVRSGFGSAEEAATGLQSLMSAYVKEQKQLKKLGVNVFSTGPDGQKKLRDFADITFDLISKSKGNPAVLQKVLGRVEAYKAILPLMDKGRAGLDELIKMGAGGAAELDRDFATMAQTPATKIAQAKAEIQAVLNESLVKILPVIAAAMEKIAKAVGFIADHPMESLAILGGLKLGGRLGALGSALGGPMAGGAAGAGGGRFAALAGSGYGGGGGGTAYGLMGGAKTNWRGRLGAGASAAGGMMQGAAVGMMVAETLGKDLPDFSKGVLGGIHALAGLPGPIGMLGKAVAGTLDVMLVGIAAANAALDKRIKDIAEGDLGTYAVDRAAALGAGGSYYMPDGSKASPSFTAGQSEAQLAAQGITKKKGTAAEQRSSAQYFLGRGLDKGFVQQLGEGDQSTFLLDQAKMDAYLKSDKSLSPEQRAAVRSGFMSSQQMLSGDPELRRNVAYRKGGRPVAPSPVFGSGTSMEDQMPDFGAYTGPDMRPAPKARGDHYIPKEGDAVQEVEISFVGEAGDWMMAKLKNSYKNRRQ